ncbi:efflux RND transporter periplasmic adaptor subunit [Geobacter sp. FeAm09]|nr:efflux RND transporter periplasmic adaptor subunit [Geobacter sp. FeAm09]
MNVKKMAIFIAATLAAGGIALGLRSPSPSTKAQTKVAKSVLSVASTRPVHKQWPIELSASGSVVAWQEALISAETGGLRITALRVDVGDHVRRGQILAELSQASVQADVRRYEAALSSARASLAQAKANADRARLVKGSGAISEQQVNEYLATEKTAKASVEVAEAQLAAQKVTLSQTHIVAVDDGTITSRSAVLGQVVSVGTELFRLHRQDRLEWQAEVDAKQLLAVKAGATAEVTLPSGQNLRGTVRVAAPTLSTTTSRANVFVGLPVQSGAKAGMFASGRIMAGDKGVLAVPESALVQRDGRNYLFEIGVGNKVIRRIVATGTHRDGLVEITSGIGAAAVLVASGGGFLSDGDLVTVTKE